MASAGQKVLDTFELFESICEYLQPIDLLLTSGTSKQARAVIRNSPVLQRKLFLKTESVGRVMYTDHYWRGAYLAQSDSGRCNEELMAIQMCPLASRTGSFFGSMRRERVTRRSFDSSHIRCSTSSSPCAPTMAAVCAVPPGS